MRFLQIDGPVAEAEVYRRGWSGLAVGTVTESRAVHLERWKSSSGLNQRGLRR